MTKRIGFALALVLALAFSADAQIQPGVPTYSNSTNVAGGNVQRVVVDGYPSAWSPETTPGSRSTTGTGEEDLWSATGTSIPLPSSSGLAMTVVSSSASDTSGGTGINTLLVRYLDASGNVQSATVTMAGLTPVAVATIRRVLDMHAATVGSGGVAAGNITLANGGTTYDFIVAGSNRSTTALFTVPTGKTFYMTSWHLSAAGTKDVVAKIRGTSDPNTGIQYAGVFINWDIVSLNDAATERVFQVPIKVPALTDIKITIQSSSASGALVTGLIEGYYE